jgi:hypothetical protein
LNPWCAGVLPCLLSSAETRFGVQRWGKLPSDSSRCHRAAVLVLRRSVVVEAIRKDRGRA